MEAEFFLANFVANTPPEAAEALLRHDANWLRRRKAGSARQPTLSGGNSTSSTASSPNNPNVLFAQFNLCGILFDQGKFAEAEPPPARMQQDC